MRTAADRSNNQRQDISVANAVADALSQRGNSGSQAVGFVDNRPEAKGQNVQLMVDNSSLIAKQRQQCLQLKKTTKPTELSKQQTLVTDLGTVVPQNILDGIIDVPGKSDAIWTHATNLYGVNEGKGDRYSTALDSLVVKYKDTTSTGSTPSPKETVIASNSAKRLGYDDKFTKNYASITPKYLSGENYRVNTEGYDPASSLAPTVDEGEYEGDYSNEIDLASGSIKAAWNMAASVSSRDWSVTLLDEALKAGKGLNNSEILWQQAKLAAKEKHKGALDKDTKVMEELKKISTIKRSNVINKETEETVYMAYNNDEKWNVNRDWMPGSSEFKAVLGTPNAKSSAFFLMDHLDQIEKTIDKITGKTGKGLDIKFKDI